MCSECGRGQNPCRADPISWSFSLGGRKIRDLAAEFAFAVLNPMTVLEQVEGYEILETSSFYVMFTIL